GTQVLDRVALLLHELAQLADGGALVGLAAGVGGAFAVSDGEVDGAPGTRNLEDALLRLLVEVLELRARPLELEAQGELLAPAVAGDDDDAVARDAEVLGHRGV